MVAQANSSRIGPAEHYCHGREEAVYHSFISKLFPMLLNALGCSAGGDLHNCLTTDSLELLSPVGGGGLLRGGQPLEGGAVLEAAGQLAQGGHDGELPP